MNTIPYIGEIFSLLSAIFWALAIIIFKKIGDRVSPMVINPVKSSIGLFLFIVTCIFIEIPLLPNFQFSNFDLFTLAISGIVGFGIADTIFLHSLNILGAGLSAIIDTAYSPFVIFFAFIFLGESLTKIQLIGGILIIISVIYISTQIKRIPINRAKFNQGIYFGICSIAMMAFGIVIIKPILNSIQNKPGLQIWVAGYRLFWGFITSFIIMIFVNYKKNITHSLSDKKIWFPLIISSILATYLGIATWIMGMSMTKISTASILNQTASIFIIIFAWVFLEEPISKKRFFGISIAFFGTYLVFVG